MSDDEQVVAPSQTIPNPPSVMAAAWEENTTQYDQAGGDKQEDVLPEDEMPGASSDDAELAGEDEAGDNITCIPAPAKHEASVEEPYDFERCTIQIGLQLLPDDGDPAGRPVVVGVRNHADAPIVN